MNKPLLAVGALMLAGIGTAGVVFVASSGGEEEVVQQVETASPSASASPDLSPTTSAQPTAAATPLATSSPAASGPPEGWEVYTDPQLGFSFPHPPRLTQTEQSFDFFDKSGNSAGRIRTLSFRNPDGTPAMSVAIGPNPDGLILEEWIMTFPGWPSEPQVVTIAGEPALLFETNQTGQRYPAIYFRLGGFVLSISGNVFGAAELGVNASPGISAAEFQQVRDGFRFGS